MDRAHPKIDRYERDFRGNDLEKFLINSNANCR